MIYEHFNNENTYEEPCLSLIITVRFTYGERKSWSDIKKSQNIMTMIACRILLTALMVKISHILEFLYFYK